MPGSGGFKGGLYGLYIHTHTHCCTLCSIQTYYILTDTSQYVNAYIYIYISLYEVQKHIVK